MRRKIVSGIVLSLLLIGMLTLAFNIQPVKADWTWAGTIYIRADGSVDPDTAPISSIDNITYTLTDNIKDVPEGSSAIVVERDNIVVDGAGHTLQGTGVFDSKGVDLSGRANVTIKNLQIKAFFYGIMHWEASNNTISGNNITNNDAGISMTRSSNNIVSGNNIINYNYYGIELHSFSNNNSISGNNLTANGTPWTAGISIWHSDNNTISGNDITNNSYYGIELRESSNNMFYGNMMNNNGYNLYVKGDRLSHFMHLIDVSNLADGKPVYYIVNQKDLAINPLTYPRVGYLGLINCSNVAVEGLNLTNVGQGLLLAYTNNTRIKANNITANRHSGIFLQSSDNNTIAGNNITNNGNHGVLLWESLNNSISENSITKNKNVGIYLRKSSDNNNISGNNITNNGDGIDLYESSSHNNIIGNKIADNTHNGIALDSSSNNIVSGNNITNSDFYGVFVFKSSNSIIGNEIANDGDYGIWLWYSFNCSVSGNNITNNGLGIRVLESSYNTIYRNDITNNTEFGIYLDGSSNNKIYGNNITNNNVGIRPLDSSNNRICGNNIANNSNFGIYFTGGSGNTISENDVIGNEHGIRFLVSSNNVVYHNNFINNVIQASTHDSTNIWDNGYPSGGNYWSGYIGTDANGDGIGDTPNLIDENNQDNYPLMEPWSTPTMHAYMLIRTEKFWNLHKGTEYSLTSKLEGTLHHLYLGKENAAAHKLMAFINQVEGLRGKKLANDQADYLISGAQRIIDLIKE